MYIEVKFDCYAYDVIDTWREPNRHLNRDSVARLGWEVTLNGLDLVLVVHWLEQLGITVCNWKQLTIEFQ